MPFDGARKLRAVDGELEMWDVPYDSRTNQLMIGFDTDRDQDGFAGFHLTWSVKKAYEADFKDATESINWIRDGLVDIINRRHFIGHGRTSVKKRIDGYCDSAINAIKRERSCAKHHSQDLSGNIKINDETPVSLSHLNVNQAQHTVLP